MAGSGRIHRDIGGESATDAAMAAAPWGIRETRRSTPDADAPRLVDRVGRPTAAPRRAAPRPPTDPNAQGIGAQADDGASTHGRVRGTAQGRAPLRAPALMELFDTTQLGLQRAIEGAA